MKMNHYFSLLPANLKFFAECSKKNGFFPVPRLDITVSPRSFAYVRTQPSAHSLESELRAGSQLEALKTSISGFPFIHFAVTQANLL